MARQGKRKDNLATRSLRAGLFLSLGFILIIVLLDACVEFKAKDRTYDSIASIPKNKVALVLGTSKYSTSGENLFYKARIEAAVKLFKSGKVEYLLISGDNGTKYYNEPKTIREDLIAKGIPSDKIVLDFAGFRTLDSIVRAREVFQQDKITVVSQQFHNERALFIASFKGVDAIGFNAEDVRGERGFGIKVRERLARINMLWDIITEKQPKFLGEQINIGD